MGLRINTNLASINAQRNISAQESKASHAFAALSSGSRITKAADDAAGLAISENLRGQTRGIAMAKNNAQSAVSLVQISEGGLNEINNILIRLRELGVQASSDTVSDVERGFLDKEAQQLISEGDRIAKSTRFGKQNLLDGSSQDLEFQVGPYAGEENIIRYNIKADATSGGLGYDGVSVADKSSARDTLELVDNALEKLGGMRANFGAMQNRLITTSSNLDVQYENLSAANSVIRDADIAKETADLASAQILQNASISVLAQANQQGAQALKLL